METWVFLLFQKGTTMSVLSRFLVFLKMDDESLKRCVDLYNAGKLSPKSMMALEAIEAAYDDDLVKRS
jgi:hypothetical protein